ncbi:MAG TPA: amidase [Acidimicrobiales bacterium]|nr:amidase [Acidimicrobiales bacterium]
MSLGELLDGDATGIAAAIARRDVTPTEVVAAAIDRIAERNPALNAVIAERAEAAMADAAAVVPGAAPLAGVPFVVKDLGAKVAGSPSTGGSRLFAIDAAPADTELVARYRRAGLVILGMTNTPELGLSASTEPVLHGPTRNPHDRRRSPGGSSGGTAAAVASGMVPVGHASDGGGSIRIPASACGLVGLKPTRGRTPTYPIPGALSAPLSVNHALARSVRDSALLLDVAAGPVPGDPTMAPPPSRPFLDEASAAPGRLRIAVSSARPDGTPVHPDCAAAVRDLADLLASLGHEVSEAAPEIPLDGSMTALAIGMAAPLASKVDARLEELGRGLADDDLEPFTRVMYDVGKGLTGVDVVRALDAVEQVAQAVGPFFARYDLLLTATLAEPAPELGVLDTTKPEVMYARAGDFSAMTSIYNITGQPAISLPTGRDTTGVPIGTQLATAFGGEALLLRIAAQIEQARPWPTRPAWPTTL